MGSSLNGSTPIYSLGKVSAGIFSSGTGRDLQDRFASHCTRKGARAPSENENMSDITIINGRASRAHRETQCSKNHLSRIGLQWDLDPKFRRKVRTGESPVVLKDCSKTWSIL